MCIYKRENLTSKGNRLFKKVRDLEKITSFSICQDRKYNVPTQKQDWEDNGEIIQNIKS